MKIVHVSNFPLLKSGKFIYGIPFKLSHALARLGHFVLNFADREIADSYLLQIRSLGAPYVNRQLIRLCEETQPDLVLMGHSTLITAETLAVIRDKVKGVRIAQWNCDGLFLPDNLERLMELSPLVDMTFVTTAGDLQSQIVTGGGHVAFMPNPVDPTVETLRVFANEGVENDLIFLAGRHSYNADRARFCEQVKAVVPDLKFDVRGLGDRPAAFGASLFEALNNAKMGLNLSARNDIPLYSSDRMAQLMGCGLLTLVDRATGFEALFAEDELVTYSGMDELADKLDFYRRNDQERRKIARRGWERVHRDFNADLVAQWILDGAFEGKPSHPYAWPTGIQSGSPSLARVKKSPRRLFGGVRGVPVPANDPAKVAAQ